MNPEFERWRRELTEPVIEAFEALCFHRADEVAAPYTALMNAPALREEKGARSIMERVFDAANGNFDTELLTNALADAFEGPGCMPGLVEVRGEVGPYSLCSRNIYQERGALFTLDNLAPPRHRGLTSDPEYYFYDVRGSNTKVLFNCFHLTKLGLEFAQWAFPERIEKLRERERR
jgi:hypothetical protein